MPDASDKLWKYAPLWATLLGASNTLLKKLLTRYITKRRFRLQWSDLVTSLAVALVSYISFRRTYGDELGDSWYKR